VSCPEHVCHLGTIAGQSVQSPAQASITWRKFTAMHESLDKECEIRLLASEKNWIEGNAVRQLAQTARRKGMLLAVGLPDLHPGKYGPVGAAFLSEGVLYPDLVGNEIGCGVGLWATDLRLKKLKLDRWANKLHGLESPSDDDRATWLATEGLEPTGLDEALGTIGGGNHFAELQAVETVNDPETFDTLGLRSDQLMLTVHSGSRNLGERLISIDQGTVSGLEDETPEAASYLNNHDLLLKWARANRSLIAHRFLDALGAETERIVDVAHNSISRKRITGCDAWLHRKGAAPSDEGPVVVPGSRGALSYLVIPEGNQAGNGWSIAHGAGRKWSRGETKGRMRARFSAQSLQQTSLGSRVICEDKELLYQEAPQAYKNIGVVIQDMLDAKIVRIVATLRPLITYKTRRTR
jgi:release factor H-coupled RctB family protein